MMSKQPRQFGVWAGDPDGRAERLADCREEVFPAHGIHYQCCRKRGHGLNGWFCKQHAKRHPAKIVAEDRTQ